jgi:hypothetical protein
MHNQAVIRTERQRAASRLNGARSRGPVTAAGKRHSSRNSLRHGLYSRTAPPLPVAAHEPLARLRADLTTAYQPRTVFAQRLVEQAAIASWRMGQLQALETATMNAEIARQRLIRPLSAPAELIALAFRRLIDETGTLRLINRLEARYERLCDRALDRLEKSDYDETNLTTGSKQTITSAPPSRRNTCLGSSLPTPWC